MTSNKNMLIDFTHRQSAHCENGVTANLLKYHKFDIDEAMVFGIGSGLFFAYMPFVKVNNLPVISFRPLPGVIFSRVCKRLNIKFVREKFRNPQKAMQALDVRLEKGFPVGLQVGVYNLSYFPIPYRFHFNAHNLVVFGKQNGMYQISDPVMEHTTELSYNELMEVRFAKGVFAPRGQMYYPLSFPENIDFTNAIKKGIKKTCSDMLTIPIPLFGAKGILHLSKQIGKWYKKYDQRRASQHLGQIIRAQEEIGTGGAGFRFIFAAFLQKSAKITGNTQFAELSKEMTGIGDNWREFAVLVGRICKNRIDNHLQAYQDAALMLAEISQKETELYKTLKKVEL